MSFFDDASLVFLPSGQAGKDGKAYSMKPTNGNGDFTFSRGSNLTATRVDSNGLIEKGRENLLTYSNDFSNVAWTKYATLTSGQSGYDGSSDAWLMTKSGANGSIVQNANDGSTISTFSIYAKAGDSDFMRVTSGGKTTFFNLLNGTINSGSNAIYNAIELIANGWYRCIISVNPTSTNLVIYPAEDGSTTATSGSIYIQDAQLEIGLTSTEYIESGATTGKAGILEDSPRFDYSGGASCPSLLLEPSRTQLIPQSEYFNFSGYTTFNSTINDNATTSPEGLINAAEIAGDGTTGQVFLRENITLPSVGNYTFSLFAKYKDNSDATNIMLDISSFGNGNGTCFFDIENGVKGTESGVTGNIEDYGSGWYRCSITTNITDGTDLFGRLQFYAANSSESLSFSPNNANADLYIYGFQMEEGSYPTSYIPNHSGGSVTRAAEGQSYSGLSSLIGQTEGTLFLEIDSSSNNTEIFSLNRSTTNAVFLRAVSNVYGVYIYADGATYIANTSININDKIKIAIAYESRNFAIYANGSQVSTNTSNWTPNITIDTLNFNVGGYISSKGKVNFNKVLLFKERISNGNLATLTS